MNISSKQRCDERVSESSFGVDQRRISSTIKDKMRHFRMMEIELRLRRPESGGRRAEISEEREWRERRREDVES